MTRFVLTVIRSAFWAFVFSAILGNWWVVAPAVFAVNFAFDWWLLGKLQEGRR